MFFLHEKKVASIFYNRGQVDVSLRTEIAPLTDRVGRRGKVWTVFILSFQKPSLVAVVNQITEERPQVGDIPALPSARAEKEKQKKEL